MPKKSEPLKLPAKKKVVFVEWVDAWGSNRWHDVEDAVRDAMVCFSIGIVLERTDKGILLCQSGSHDNDSVAATHFIPAGCIKRVVRMGDVVGRKG